METKIVIFLAFTAVTLAFNSVIIWFAYKSFSSITTKMTETIREIAIQRQFQSLVEGIGNRIRSSRHPDGCHEDSVEQLRTRARSSSFQVWFPAGTTGCSNGEVARDDPETDGKDAEGVTGSGPTL